MSRKSLLKRGAAVVAMGLSLCIATNSIPVSAFKNVPVSQNNQKSTKENAKNCLSGLDGKYEVSFQSMYYFWSEQKEKEEMNKISAGINQAFINCVLEVKASTVNCCFNTKEFKIDGKRTYINKIEAIVFENGKEVCKDMSVVSKNAEGIPTAFLFNHNPDKIENSTRYRITYSQIENKSSISCVEVVFNTACNKNTDKKCDKVVSYFFDKTFSAFTRDNKDIKNEEVKQDDNKKVDAKALDNKADSKAESKANNKIDKSPQTADSMSTGVKVASIAGIMSVMAVIGVLVFRRRKENI